MQIHGTTKSPLLPSRLAQFVQAIVGLTNYPTFASDAVRTPSLAPGVAPSKVQNGALTPEDFAKQYNLNPLYAHHATGQGTTIGIVTLASVDPTVPQYFWSNILGINTLPNRISLVNVDGGSGPVADASGSGETTLDVEQSGALAPNAKIVVYQAPNTDLGFLDGFFAAASAERRRHRLRELGRVGDLSSRTRSTRGSSRPPTPTASTRPTWRWRRRARARSSRPVTSAPTTAFEDLGTTNLSAGQPGQQPVGHVRGRHDAAGGRSRSAATVSVKIPAERTWGWDWLWPNYAVFGAPSEAAFAFANPLGGGGGFSAVRADAGLPAVDPGRAPVQRGRVPDADRLPVDRRR